MRKWRNDFKTTSNYETWYDLFEDWHLIESSFAQQYGIRLRKKMDDMEWGEFSSLLAGLNGDTPLGNIVRIRSENDPETLKKFTASEKKIRSEWLNKNATQISAETYKQAMNNFKEMFIALSENGSR
jgi:hypothetical protein|nr:MAG TPA: hypothetical protein [Caudoviricetes sp.]